MHVIDGHAVGGEIRTQAGHNYLDYHRGRFDYVTRKCCDFCPDQNANVLDIGRSQLSSLLLEEYGSVTTMGLPLSRGSNLVMRRGRKARPTANLTPARVPPLAVELAPLRVNAVSPGVIDTQWWHGMPAEQRGAFFQAAAAASPVGRIGTARDVAGAIRHLAGAGFVTGTVLECAGGANLTVGAVAG